MWLVDLGSRSDGGSNHSISNYLNIFLVLFPIIRIIRLIHIMAQVDALLKTLELQESAQRKGHFALFNCLVLGHTKYRGSIMAAAENRSKTLAYQTVSGDTTNAPLSMPGGRIMTRSIR